MLHSLGKITITTPGTLVVCTINESNPVTRYPCNAMLVEVWPTNTGKIYVCDRVNAVVATGVGVLAVLAPPSTNFIPSFSATLPYAPGALNLAAIWIDAEVAGEGAVVSAVVG